MDIQTAKKVVRDIKKAYPNKVYGSFLMRKINGQQAEYSFMVKDDETGNIIHVFSGDFRCGDAPMMFRRVKDAKDFCGYFNNEIHIVCGKGSPSQYNADRDYFLRQMHSLFNQEIEGY